MNQLIAQTLTAIRLLLKLEKLKINYLYLEESTLISNNTINLHFHIVGAIKFTINGKMINPRQYIVRIFIPNEPFTIYIEAQGLFSKISKSIQINNILERPKLIKKSHPIKIINHLIGVQTPLRAISFSTSIFRYDFQPTRIPRPSKTNLPFLQGVSTQNYTK